MLLNLGEEPQTASSLAGRILLSTNASRAPVRVSGGVTLDPTEGVIVLLD